MKKFSLELLNFIYALELFIWKKNGMTDPITCVQNEHQ